MTAQNVLLSKCFTGLLYLVEENSNPSTDYFVLPTVSHLCANVVRCGFGDLPDITDLDGAIVVFVRYIPSSWLKLIELARPRLHSLIFFMDDDVLDIRASAGMPLRYRIKLARFSASRLYWLRRHEAILWVSSAYLKDKYSEWKPHLVFPSPVAALSSVRRVFYHGTASHDAEIRWLRPVVEEALFRCEKLVFEIVGGAGVYKLYRSIPRVNVVHPMRWPAYQSFLNLHGRHIGLAPLLAGQFNKARSYTKFFDFTRCGAIGIYSPNSASAEIVTHKVDGLVVELDRQAWATAIIDISLDNILRELLLKNAKIKSADLDASAKKNNSNSLFDICMK